MTRKSILEINGLSVGVELKPIKCVHLSVYPPDGRVHVSAPLECSMERLRGYILEKWVWIEEKRRAIVDYPRQEKREYVSGEAHYFRGSLYRLKVETDNHVSPHVSIRGDYLVITQRAHSSVARRGQILHDWYKQELTPLLDKYIAKWQEILGVRLGTYQIRAMSLKWGTCSKAKSKILFNVELAKKPVICVEYIVAHELAHLIEPTHNANFTSLLDHHFPEWRTIKRELNYFPV